MNRKLVNGLLLLTVATAGCGTFTSCKDTDEDYKNEILLGQADINQAIKKLQDWQKLFDQTYPDWQNGDLDESGCTCPDLKKVLDFLQYNSETGEFAFQDATITDLIKRLIDLEVNPLKDNIAELNTITTALYDRIRVLPTDIILNQVHNNIFGTLNLPIGLQSNILGTYYYQADHDVTFPFEGKEVADPEAVTAATEAGFQYPTLPLTEGVIYGKDGAESNIDLGALYVTVNPSYIDFTDGVNGANMKLVTSDGVEAPVDLKAATSTEKLVFGRAASAGNLYKVSATMPATAENINQIGVKIEGNLKASLKDLINSESKSGAVAGVAKIAELIYQNLDGFLPAYGIKASWQSQTGEVEENAGGEVGSKTYTAKTDDYYSVSKYEIAATTFHPLSYEFGQDFGTSKHLPTFGPISEAFDRVFNDLKKDIKIKLNGLGGFEKITINVSDVNTTIGSDDIVIELAGKKVYGTDESGNVVEIGTLGKDANITLYKKDDNGVATGDLAGLIKDIQDVVNNVNGQSTSVKNQVETQVNDMIDKINEQLGGINADLDKQVKDILNSIHDQIAGKLGAADKLVALYDRLANKVNSFLKDPNAYLQSAALYKGTDGGLHILSTDANQPSVFVKNGNGAELFLTSLNGELIVPAYKKYVAFLDGTKMKGFNEILDGTQKKVALDVQSLAPGKHTLVYSALDYRGRTSTRLYYILVKE